MDNKEFAFCLSFVSRADWSTLASLSRDEKSWTRSGWVSIVLLVFRRLANNASPLHPLTLYEVTKRQIFWPCQIKKKKKKEQAVNLSQIALSIYLLFITC